MSTRKRATNDYEESDSSDDGDKSDYDSDSSILHSNSENDSDENSEIDDNLEGYSDFPSQSYSKIYNSYNTTQKKLENDHKFEWLPGEKEYEDNLSNEILLSEKDKLDIMQKSIVELFEIFFSSELRKYIVDATNVNGYPLTDKDFKVFIGIICLSSINRLPSQRDYWSKNSLLRSEAIVKAMSRNKFMFIKSNLKYALPEDRNDEDKVWKVRKILDIFRKNILKYGFFSTALSVDEMMLKFFGRLSIKQFIKSKPIRFGIKMWGICGAGGYLYDFDVYCGKDSDKGSKLGKIAMGSRVVIQMLNKLLTQTTPRKLVLYHLYFDNLFCCPDLLVHLKKVGLRATGVVRSDRIREKNFIDKDAPKGTYVAKHDKNSGLNFITARDSKDVSILSTAAGVSPQRPMKRYVKSEHAKVDVNFPNAFSKYNQFMGGVDLHDQHCNRLLPSIRSKKWTWIPFVRILQASATNATVLYNTVREKKNHIKTKDTALAICEEYFREASDTNEHNIILSKNANNICNIEKCVIKTRNFCKTCQSYICKGCLQKNESCSIIKRKKLDENMSEEHTMIISPKKSACTNDLCTTRTQRFCTNCKIHICKKCSDQDHT